MPKEVLNAEEAAKIIGCTSQKMRERIKKRVWKFGDCIPKNESGKKQNSYLIYTRKMYKHFEMELEDDKQEKI